MTRKKTEETKAADGLEQYSLQIPLRDIEVEGFIEGKKIFLFFLDVQGSIKYLKKILLDGDFTREVREKMLEQYVEHVILQDMGIKSLPVNLQKQPKFKKYIKKTGPMVLNEHISIRIDKAIKKGKENQGVIN